MLQYRGYAIRSFSEKFNRYQVDIIIDDIINHIRLIMHEIGQESNKNQGQK